MEEDPQEVCKACAHHAKAPRKELALFPNGIHYLVTGECRNTESPLYGKKLAGAFAPKFNASINRVQIRTNLVCFKLASTR